MAVAAEVDGDQRPTNRVVACWTVRSEARTMDAEPLVAAVAAATAPLPTTLAVVKPSVIGQYKKKKELKKPINS